MIFFTCRTRTEHLYLLEIFQRTREHILTFQKKALEIRSELLFKGNI